jgi:hypothetical protein
VGIGQGGHDTHGIPWAEILVDKRMCMVHCGRIQEQCVVDMFALVVEPCLRRLAKVLHHDERGQCQAHRGNPQQSQGPELDCAQTGQRRSRLRFHRTAAARHSKAALLCITHTHTPVVSKERENDVREHVPIDHHRQPKLCTHMNVSSRMEKRIVAAEHIANDHTTMVLMCRLRQ